MVRRICRRFAHTPEPQEDLIQVGCIGLIRAAERFDPDKGRAFASFAIPEILGEVLNYFRDHGWAVKVPRKLQRQKMLFGRPADALAQRLARWPTVAEIAQAASLTEDQVLEAMMLECNGKHLSLDSDGSGNDLKEGELLLDALGEVDPAYEELTHKLLLEKPLASLDERERSIVHMSFYEELPQTEIARRLDISQMHVSRLLHRALDNLREAPSHPLLSPSPRAGQGKPPRHVTVRARTSARNRSGLGSRSMTTSTTTADWPEAMASHRRLPSYRNRSPRCSRHPTH